MTSTLVSTGVVPAESTSDLRQAVISFGRKMLILYDYRPIPPSYGRQLASPWSVRLTAAFRCSVKITVFTTSATVKLIFTYCKERTVQSSQNQTAPRAWLVSSTRCCQDRRDTIPSYSLGLDLRRQKLLLQSIGSYLISFLSSFNDKLFPDVFP